MRVIVIAVIVIIVIVNVVIIIVVVQGLNLKKHVRYSYDAKLIRVAMGCYLLLATGRFGLIRVDSG